MFLDLHVIQTIPFANLNRDDVGSPKTLMYGGTQRLRVSSQAWKRAARMAIEGGSNATYRTRNPYRRLAELLDGLGFDEDLAVAVARWAFGEIGTDTKDGESSVILFAAEVELAALANIIAEKQAEMAVAWDAYLVEEAASTPTKKTKVEKRAKFDASGLSNKELSAVFRGVYHADSVGLFGRMLASDASINVDAAVQVAHAFSTHQVEFELDFFNAAEDLPDPEQGEGGAHLGTAEFASGTLYRYAVVDIRELLGHCGGDVAVARALVGAFASAFALSIPSGKKNSTAPNSLPSLVAAVVRADRPVSYAGAFESAIKGRGGFDEASVDELARYSERTARFVDAPVWSGHVGGDSALNTSLGDSYESLGALVNAAGQAVTGVREAV